MVSSADFGANSTLKVFNVLALSKYDRLGASSRLRFMQYLPWLQLAGFNVSMQPLLSDALVASLYTNGGYSPWALIAAYCRRVGTLLRRRKFDLLWIEKEALPWTPLLLERLLLYGSSYVLDYDDAIFHQYDQHANGFVRWMYGRRIDALMAHANLVVSGNNYLAQRARDAGAKNVVVIPTVIDLDRYQVKNYQQVSESQSQRPCIVWIGSPSTLRYLDVISAPLAALALEFDFTLRVIGGGRFSMSGVSVESIEWSETSEADCIRAADIGVMPLLDSAWERGKCGYKLVQYMASGLPVVASDVGVNSEIVVPGSNGYLAATDSDWFNALRQLLVNSEQREKFGLAGRERVERFYCVQKTAVKLIENLSLVLHSTVK